MTAPLNRDINSRFEDWLISPTETLDFEVKGWLDLSDREACGTVAKALIALENHGGGFLLIGFTEDQGRLIPDANRPPNLEQYGTDAVNAIVSSFAEPSFHVHATVQKHPETGEEFPLVRVTGGSKVPVRSRRATPSESVKQNVYYIRRPGPKSEAPMDGAEWDALIRRCVLNQRSEIIDLLRSFIPSVAPGNLQTLVDERAALNQFVADSFGRWSAINNGLPNEDPSKIKHGWFSFACQIVGQSKGLPPAQTIQAIERLRKYTGWPIFVALHQPENKPYLKDGAIEASLTKLKQPSPAHADFWRVHPEGYFYVLRGYQEDDMETLAESRKARAPGTGLDLTLPVWRVAEFLLRSEDLGRAMYEDGFSMLVRCEWSGLTGRELFMFNLRRMLSDGHRCAADDVATEGSFLQAAITDVLPDVVKRLTADLYQHFDFFQPPEKFFDEEIALMKSGRMV
jgi:hypothetical protein